MNYSVTDSTPIAMLTVGQLKNILETQNNNHPASETPNKEKRYVYGIGGIARLFNCSLPTANRIKKSGKINAAIKQIGRKIIVDAELAIELAGCKEGGRKR
ncbi:MAG: DUF3853 family protein [Bacteroidales bacterium]|jgi:hypothetical protein|nr:DUF3853 family protein [Bacteroidales bacterium]